MRTALRAALLAVAAGFLAWEVYGALTWVRQAGGLAAAFAHFWRTLNADWMMRIVVTDHLLIAAAVLAGLWLDASRQAWSVLRRLLLSVAFVALGSPTLFTYLAWRVGRHHS